MVVRKCSAKRLSWKFHKIHREIPELESLSNTVKGLQAVSPEILSKREPGTGVSEPAGCRCYAK